MEALLYDPGSQFERADIPNIHGSSLSSLPPLLSPLHSKPWRERGSVVLQTGKFYATPLRLQACLTTQSLEREK